MSKINESIEKFERRFNKLISGEIIAPTNNCKPPYGSQWEKDFEWLLSKRMPDNFTLENQYRLCGRYFADYAMICNATGRVWVFEYDGKSFHDEERDRLRDLEIFRNHKEVQSITRVDASTAKHSYDETRSKLGELVPECFHRPIKYSGAEWVKNGDVYTARKFNDSHCYDSWCDGYGKLREDAPMVNLKITHKLNRLT